MDADEFLDRADFDEVARRLAAGEDLTVVAPRYAGLWGAARYPTAVTLVAMPAAGEVGILIVPFLDLVGEPEDPDFQYYAGIVYALAVEDTVFHFREYVSATSPYEAGLLGWATRRPVGDGHWRRCPMIPYEDHCLCAPRACCGTAIPSGSSSS